MQPPQPDQPVTNNCLEWLVNLNLNFNPVCYWELASSFSPLHCLGGGVAIFSAVFRPMKKTVCSIQPLLLYGMQYSSFSTWKKGFTIKICILKSSLCLIMLLFKTHFIFPTVWKKFPPGPYLGSKMNLALHCFSFWYAVFGFKYF